MKRTMLIFSMLMSFAAHAQDFAFRIPCEIQTAGEQSLPALEWMQGTTPLIQLDVLQRGKPVNADTSTTVRLVLGPSGTGTYYSVTTGTLHSATNVTASGTNVLASYRVQMPTIGTNSAGVAWWYTIFFEKSGHRYWTGAGELYIVKTTSTDPDGIVWQTNTTGSAWQESRVAAVEGRTNAWNAGATTAATALTNAATAQGSANAESNRAIIAEAGLLHATNGVAYNLTLGSDLNAGANAVQFDSSVEGAATLSLDYSDMGKLKVAASTESLVDHSRAGLIAAAVYCDTPTNSYEFLPATNGEPGSVLLPWKPHYDEGGTPVTTNWWKRNPDFFLTRAGYDVSGFKVSGDWITERNITLLSPRLAVGARHVEMYAGNTAIFVSMNGIAWTGTVSAVATNFTGGNNPDVALYLLTNVAPSYIVPVPVLDSSNWLARLPWWEGTPDSTNGPVFFSRHQQKNWGGGAFSSIYVPGRVIDMAVTNYLDNSSTWPAGAAWDSSQPLVVPIDGRLVYLCNFFSARSCVLFSAFRDQVDAQAAAWGVDGPEWVTDLRGIADRVTGTEVTLDATRTELLAVGGVASNALSRAEFRRGGTENSITGSLYFASVGVGTNVIYVTGAGDTNFNGTYLWEGTQYTNSAAGASAYHLHNPVGTWAFRSVPPLDMYTSSSLAGHYMLASGDAPAPVVTLGTNFTRLAENVLEVHGTNLIPLIFSSITNSSTALLTNGTRSATFIDYVAPAAIPSAPATGNVRVYGQTVNGQEYLNYIQPDGATFRIGRDTFHTGIADESLTNGQAVYWTTNMTTTAHHIRRARADSESTMSAQGVVMFGAGGIVTNGGSCVVMSQGRTPTNYLSAALAALPYSTPLYVSTLVAGELSALEPSAPNVRQAVGFVNYNGAMDVRLGGGAVVDDVAAALVWQLWSGSNSTVIVDGITKAMRTIDQGLVGGTNTINISSNNQYIAYCSLPAGLTALKSGAIHLNATIWHDGGGGDAISLAAEVYVRQTNGTQVEISTGTAQVIGTTPLELIYSMALYSNVTLNATDSIMLKLKTSGFSSTPTVRISSGQLSIDVPGSQYTLATTHAAHTNLAAHVGIFTGTVSAATGTASSNLVTFLQLTNKLETSRWAYGGVRISQATVADAGGAASETYFSLPANTTTIDVMGYVFGAHTNTPATAITNVILRWYGTWQGGGGATSFPSNSTVTTSIGTSGANQYWGNKGDGTNKLFTITMPEESTITYNMYYFQLLNTSGVTITNLGGIIKYRYALPNIP